MSAVTAGRLGLDVDYPEGELVPEGDLQLRRRIEVVVALRHWLAEQRPDAAGWVLSDINVYYREGEPKAVVAPDVAVAFGVNTEAVAGASTYKVWEAGAAPCFVLEIASPGTYRTDERDKPATYAALGVQEYWRLDPTGGEMLTPPLLGKRRAAGRWEPIPTSIAAGGAIRGTSDVLGLELRWQHPKLRLLDAATGQWLLDPDDLAAAHRATRTRAQREADRAQRETTRADREAARADREAAARRSAEAELAALRQRLQPPDATPHGTGR
ncbi:MAG: Uma2 family endonuclease [bacterium]|nr:Uma2 family endonuclease [bacterium]MCY4104196.1 Uma2 family endonuclease [bacterium]